MTRRRILTLVGAAVGVLGASLLADTLVPPANATLPLTLYVDPRIGDDAYAGRLPDQPLATLEEATRRARPGTDILLTGYGERLPYPGTGTKCLTVVGSAKQPVVIRRNIYTNTLRPTVLTTVKPVRGPWTLREQTASHRTWSTPWPDPIRLIGDPDYGFIKIGGIALTGYARPPGATVDEAGWWADGQLYLRSGQADPHRYPVAVKDGDGICLSSKSRHVRIKDLMIIGAVHAVRAEPGAVDIQVEHVVRGNVLDGDRLPGEDPEAGEPGAVASGPDGAGGTR